MTVELVYTSLGRRLRFTSIKRRNNWNANLAAYSTYGLASLAFWIWMLQELNKTKQAFHTNRRSPGGRTRSFMKVTKPWGNRTRRGPNASDYENTMWQLCTPSPCSSFSPKTKQTELPTVSTLSYHAPLVGQHPNTRQNETHLKRLVHLPSSLTNKCTIY
jgi:hypothetical protein